MMEFLTVAGAHLLAVASPGPDFAVVLKQSLGSGRRAALWTSVGIACGICVHVGYSLLGLGLLLKSSPPAFAALKYAGAAYLAWLGVQALRAKPAGRPTPSENAKNASAGRTMEQTGAPARRPERTKNTPARRTVRGAWTMGFLTNALNPKATLFFVALFAVVISPQTPRLVRAAYGVWMVVATGAWFALVSVAFTRPSVRRAFLRHGHWIDRGMGVVLLAFAARLAFASLN